jgi:hypothetical protein
MFHGSHRTLTKCTFESAIPVGVEPSMAASAQWWSISSLAARKMSGSEVTFYRTC